MKVGQVEDPLDVPIPIVRYSSRFVIERVTRPLYIKKAK